jgi:hypothetical protein
MYAYKSFKIIVNGKGFAKLKRSKHQCSINNNKIQFRMFNLGTNAPLSPNPLLTAGVVFDFQFFILYSLVLALIFIKV